jgi:hypothetical protein
MRETPQAPCCPSITRFPLAAIDISHHLSDLAHIPQQILLIKKGQRADEVGNGVRRSLKTADHFALISPPEVKPWVSVEQPACKSLFATQTELVVY